MIYISHKTTRGICKGLIDWSGRNVCNCIHRLPCRRVPDFYFQPPCGAPVCWAGLGRRGEERSPGGLWFPPGHGQDPGGPEQVQSAVTGGIQPRFLRSGSAFYARNSVLWRNGPSERFLQPTARMSVQWMRQSLWKIFPLKGALESAHRLVPCYALQFCTDNLLHILLCCYCF